MKYKAPFLHFAHSPPCSRGKRVCDMERLWFIFADLVDKKKVEQCPIDCKVIRESMWNGGIERMNYHIGSHIIVGKEVLSLDDEECQRTECEDVSRARVAKL